MENQIKIPGGFIPAPKTFIAPITECYIPKGATEGPTQYGQGGGKFYRNVYKQNRMIGYAVYSNGCGLEPQGFLHYEPLPSPAVPPNAICAAPYCDKVVGEVDAELFFEGFNDAIAAQGCLCQECQYFHDTDETRFAVQTAS